MNSISLSLEMPTKSNSIINRLQHNFRNTSHKNIVNQNDNYFFENREMKTIEVLKNKEKDQRKIDLEKYKDFLNDGLEENFKLLSQTRKKNEKSIPMKNRLTPFLEGVIHFGNVYDIGCEEEERLSKTKIFNDKISLDLENGLMEQIQNNLETIEKEFDTTISNLVLHRDENGLHHFHFIMKNYDSDGNSLNVRQNKNNIGVRVQDIICDSLSSFGLKRGEENSKRIKLSKQEYIEKRELQIEVKKLREEVKLHKEDLDLVKLITNAPEKLRNIALEVWNNTQIMNTNEDFQKKGMKFEKKLEWCLTHIDKDEASIQDELLKLKHGMQKAMTALDKKSKTEIK